MLLHCPHCKASIPFDRQLAGREILCPNCNQKAKMPLWGELPKEFTLAYSHEKKELEARKISEQKQHEEAYRQEFRKKLIAEKRVIGPTFKNYLPAIFLIVSALVALIALGVVANYYTYETEMIVGGEKTGRTILGSENDNKNSSDHFSLSPHKSHSQAPNPFGISEERWMKIYKENRDAGLSPKDSAEITNVAAFIEQEQRQQQRIQKEAREREARSVRGW